MSKRYSLGDATLYAGDCLDILSELDLVDAVVTDPPYNLLSVSRAGSARRNDPATPFGRTDRGGFMNMQWDGTGIAFRPETWALVAGVLRPGGFLLAFGGTRTQHRMVSAIEDAGLVIQDTIAWLYGTGFPKNKALLKPAFEPIVVAYKPGGARTLQVDECRIPTNCSSDSANGRWPANVIHDGSAEVMEAFAAYAGGMHSAGHARNKLVTTDYNATSYNLSGTVDMRRFGDTGTAVRFFYCAKAGKADRAGSKHPTVKPIALIRYLVKLVCPPGGTVLDPFAGSGTTGAAALAEGRKAILIEREAEYVADIRRRLGIAAPTKGGVNGQPRLLLDGALEGAARRLAAA